MLLTNIKLSFISQIYTIFASIIFIPYFMDVLGNEAYGLVGFFGSLQVVFSLLDMGLASVILRETSFYLGSSKNQSESEVSIFYSFCKILNYIFILVGGAIFLSLMSLNSYFSHNWFNYVVLTPEDISFCLIVMTLFIVCKWMSGFYKAVISGAEKFNVITYINIFVTTVRYVSVIPIFYFYKADVKIFFLIQLIAGVFETFILFYYYRQYLPRDVEFNSSEGISKLKSLLGFSSYAGLTSLLYVILTQVDKVYLSKILKLDVFGLFSFSIVLATLINLCAAPIQHALQPRLVYLFSVNSRSQFYEYFKSIYVVFAILILFITGLVFLSIKPILLLLSYSPNEIEIILNISQLYLVGNSLFLIASMSFFMQYTLGNLKYHLIGQAIICVFFCISVFVFSKEYEYVATGVTWVFLNVVYIVLWIPFVYSRLLPEYKVNSYLNDLIKIVFIPFICISIIHYTIDFKYTDSMITIFGKLSSSCLIFITIIVICYNKIMLNNFAKLRSI